MPATSPLTLANLLTLGRIAAVPVVGVLLAMNTATPAWIAFWLFVAAAVTDFLDGFVARTFNQQSELGRMLDPIADKLIIAVVLVVLVGIDVIDDWSLLPASAILARELVISGLREFLAPKGIVIHVSKLAKWKTTAQLVAVGVLMLVPAIPELAMIGLLGLWVAGGLTVVTGYEYLHQSLAHLLATGTTDESERP